MKKSPCLTCEKRYPACHGDCEEYKEWQSDIHAAKQSLNKDYALDNFTIINAEKIRKRRRRKK